MLKKPSILAILAVAAAIPLGANPEGGQVAAGSASIAGQGSSTVTVNQSSNTAIINWQSFSIGSNEATKFIQPSSTSAALNRVLGGQTSIIDGTLSANGRIFLLNGNGILVGQNGVITTAGFTGSTRNITDSDFLSGNLHFTGSGDGVVTNYGKISALGGDVVLIGKTVDNEGTITASNTAALAAGDDVLLAQMNADGSTVTVNPVASPTPARGKVGVKNSGTIKASAAELKAANGNIYALAIQNDGLIQATTVTEQGGHIFLTSDAGTIVNSGMLNASATVAKGHGGSILVKSKAGKVVHTGKIIAKGGQGGVGGNAEVSGAQVSYSGSIDLTAPGGATGDFLLDPSSLDIVSGANNANDITTGTPDTNNSGSSSITNGSVNNALSGSNLTLNATNSITVDEGAAITWTSNSTLTLMSGGTIAINAAITGTNGTLNLHAGSPTSAITTSLHGAINVGSFILAQGAWKQLINDGSNNGNLAATTTVNNVTTTNSLPGFTATQDFEIQNGTFLRASGGNGANHPYIISDIYAVQGMEGFLTTNFTGNGTFIDASSTANWNGGAGFSPIGDITSPYQGQFSYVYIESLTINRPNQDYVGLMGVLGNNGSLTGNSVYFANITGNDYVGTLVGENRGEINSVFAYDGSVTGDHDVGGIVGFQDSRNNGEQFQSQFQPFTTTTGTGTGTSDNNDIYTNFSTAEDMTVTGNNNVGGIVGETRSSIYNCTVNSDLNVAAVITGNDNVGGVAGIVDFNGSVTYSTFQGSVQNDDTPGESQDFGGIAGENDGTITNSHVFPGSSIMGDEWVGGIAGYNTGFIADCYNSGSVTGVAFGTGTGTGTGDGGNEDEEIVESDGGNRYIGGIAGENFNQSEESDFRSFAENGGPSNPGTIQTSYNTGAVSGGTYVGGLVGYNDFGSTVSTAYNVGSVTGNSYVGGVVGDNFGQVFYTYNSGAVEGTDTSTTAGIIGFDEDGAQTDNSYWDTSTSGQANPTNFNSDDDSSAEEFNLASVGSTTAYTQAGNNGANGNDGDGAGYSYFGASATVSHTNGVYSITVPQGGSPDDGGASWYIIEGQTRPMLAMEATSSIDNPHSLQLMAVNLGGSYNITHDIDMSVISNQSEVWNEPAGHGFVPVGSDPGQENVPFSGSLNGEYYTISGLYINRPTENNVGLFGYMDGGSLVNYLYLENSQITGQNRVGGLAGTSYGTIQYVTNESVGSGDGSDGLITGIANVGGLVGDNEGSISNSSNTSTYTDPLVTGSEEVGGIAGFNGDNATISQSINSATVQSTGQFGVNFGGIAGSNTGKVSQSINTGNVGSGFESTVGGIVGDNVGQVDDSYSGGGTGTGTGTGTGIGTIDGSGTVGGIVGMNESTGVVETSYNTSAVQSAEDPGTGSLIGVNSGTARHIYFDNQTTGQEAAIGINNNLANTTDVPTGGFTTAQLTDSRNFAQGSSPMLWDFSPEIGESQGIWAINAYNSGGQINNGLPVLQWQYPANAQVTATSGQKYYGYQPGYTVTGNGATQFPTYVPNPTFNVSGNPNAGGTQQISISGTPNVGGYEVEYVNGTTTIVPDPITIIANSYNISSGSPAPSYTVTYNGFQPNGSPEDLNGLLTFTVSPNTLADGLHNITPSGLSSSNYAITFVNGVLNIGTPGVTQQQLTFETELQNIQTAFGNDPTNGLDPVYFLIFPNIPGLGGDEAGAINDPADAYLAYVSGTSNLPAFDRLVTPGVGVVEIIDGVVIVGNPSTGNPIYISNPNGGLPIDVTNALQGVVSADVYKQLLPYASH